MAYFLNRRKLLLSFRTCAAAGLLPYINAVAAASPLGQVAPSANPNSPVNGTQTDKNSLLDNLSNSVSSGIQSINSSSNANMSSLSGPQISPQYNNPQPYIPSESPENELEGATAEDFPKDYMEFDPQTGLFN